MPWPCITCGQIFPLKRSLITHRTYKCIPILAVGQAKNEVQDNSIKYTKSTKERSAALKSTLVTKEKLPNLLQHVPSLKTLSKHLQSMVDYSMYAVVRSAEKYLLYDDISKSFTNEFKLGVGNEYLYIVNVESILGPLLAIPNFGGSKNEFITACPYRQWSDYFSLSIEECKENREQGN